VAEADGALGFVEGVEGVEAHFGGLGF
jgi:hypothetical protein